MKRMVMVLAILLCCLALVIGYVVLDTFIVIQNDQSDNVNTVAGNYPWKAGSQPDMYLLGNFSAHYWRL